MQHELLDLHAIICQPLECEAGIERSLISIFTIGVAADRGRGEITLSLQAKFAADLGPAGIQPCAAKIAELGLGLPA